MFTYTWQECKWVTPLNNNQVLDSSNLGLCIFRCSSLEKRRPHFRRTQTIALKSSSEITLAPLKFQGQESSAIRSRCSMTTFFCREDSRCDRAQNRHGQVRPGSLSRRRELSHRQGPFFKIPKPLTIPGETKTLQGGIRQQRLTTSGSTHLPSTISTSLETLLTTGATCPTEVHMRGLKATPVVRKPFYCCKCQFPRTVPTVLGT